MYLKIINKKRISLIREMRTYENRGKQSRRPNNNNVVIKHSQGRLGKNAKQASRFNSFCHPAGLG